MAAGFGSPSRYWAIVPAAGRSRRMDRALGKPSLPKQYLPLAGRRVLEWSLAPLLDDAKCERAVVVLAQDDQHWPGLPLARHPKLLTAIGGEERADSVRSGLAALQGQVEDDDWILVHDAARPCVLREDIESLLDQLRDDAVGGLLAAPLVDTLKRVDASARVQHTVARDALWRAFTPQMFRHGVLVRALAHGLEHRLTMTDEAQAVEGLGLQPRLVAGDSDNIKITLPEDLQRAERILRCRGVA